MIIAIDGPAGSGKGTISKFLSYHLDCASVDTGLFYRAFAYSIMDAPQHYFSNLDYLVKKAHELKLEDLNNPMLRDEAVAGVASQVSTSPIIREIITNRIRSFVAEILKSYKGVIVDGRDVGTVIFPNADVKFYVTADSSVRAERRKKELAGRSIKSNISMIIKERDERDSSRLSAPLKQADGAFVIDTTSLTIDEACQMAFRLVKKEN
jgi:cytidylate kinase